MTDNPIISRLRQLKKPDTFGSPEGKAWNAALDRAMGVVREELDDDPGGWIAREEQLESIIRGGDKLSPSLSEGDHFQGFTKMVALSEAEPEDAGGDSSQPRKLWLWKNFVDGRPEYWAFDNPYPCHPNDCPDPMTLGEPCGYALHKESANGRPDFDETEVIDAIKRAISRDD